MKLTASILSLLLSAAGCFPENIQAAPIASWDFPKTNRERRENVSPAPRACLTAAYNPGSKETGGRAQEAPSDGEPDWRQDSLPVQYPSEDFDPVLEPGMLLVVESLDDTGAKITGRIVVPIISDEIVSIPAVGTLDIVGKKLSHADRFVRRQLDASFRAGIMMGTVQTVQVLGKVQRPGNYLGYRKLSYILAEASDRSSGGNFKINFYNGATRGLSTLRYEDIVKGQNNPLVPPGSILYLPPSAGSLFGEMTEKQVNLAYLIILTLGALGVTAIARQ